MDIRIYLAPLEEKQVFLNLMQYYFYDFSEFVPAYVEDSGVYEQYPHIEHYWEKGEDHFPYLIRVNERLAGFALVKQLRDTPYPTFSMVEFFIMKRFRLAGVGKMFAYTLFNRHRGQWEVFQLRANLPAQTFWNKIIAEYTECDYVERVEEGNHIQEFINAIE